jgi:LuxR family transcriptional regulator, maltose regulon positive regulatory protein
VTTGQSLLHLARLRAARGDHGAARQLLDELETILAPAPDPGTLPDRLADARRRLAGAAGETAPGEPLSDRELEVLGMLATPLSQREIGDRLYVSLNTVKTHAKRIYRKLEVSGRSQAVARARERGIL